MLKIEFKIACLVFWKTALQIIPTPSPLPALLIQRDQSEVAQQVSWLQSEKRVSYGNDALMPSETYSTTPLDELPPEQDGLGFIHPESFNQANTENHGKTPVAAPTHQPQLTFHLNT